MLFLNICSQFWEKKPELWNMNSELLYINAELRKKKKFELHDFNLQLWIYN